MRRESSAFGTGGNRARKRICTSEARKPFCGTDTRPCRQTGFVFLPLRYPQHNAGAVFEHSGIRAGKDKG